MIMSWEILAKGVAKATCVEVGREVTQERLAMTQRINILKLSFNWSMSYRRESCIPARLADLT